LPQSLALSAAKRLSPRCASCTRHSHYVGHPSGPDPDPGHLRNALSNEACLCTRGYSPASANEPRVARRQSCGATEGCLILGGAAPLRVAIVGAGKVAGGYDKDRSDGNVFSHAGAYRAHGGFDLLVCIEPD